MIKTKQKREKRYIRHRRIRKKLYGTKECPRLSVFRSNQHIYLQLINDEQGKTLFSANDLKFKKTKKNKMEIAKEIGQVVAKEALAQKIKKVVFDRGGYKYHGRIKAVAEGARQGGLEF